MTLLIVQYFAETGFWLLGTFLGSLDRKSNLNWLRIKGKFIGSHDSKFQSASSSSSYYLVFCPFRAALAAYGGSQARGLIGAAAAGFRQSHSNARSIRAASETYTTAHGHARSLNHWARRGIEPATSWFPVRFVSNMPWREPPEYGIFDL